MPSSITAYSRAGVVRTAGLAGAIAALALAGTAGISASASASDRASAGPPGTPFAYVAESGSNDVVPFDASRITPLGYPGAPIRIKGSPGALLASANNQFVYVASTAGVTPIGIFTVARPPEHAARASRLLNILMDGLRAAPR